MKINLARFKFEASVEVTWINHWSHCTRDGGHAILLGFQYGAWSDYRKARQLRLEITLLGIGFEFKGPLFDKWEKVK